MAASIAKSNVRTVFDETYVATRPAKRRRKIETFTDVLRFLQAKPENCDSQWTAQCPWCTRRSAGLRWDPVEKRPVIVCRMGCDFYQMLEVLDLTVIQWLRLPLGDGLVIEVKSMGKERERLRTIEKFWVGQLDELSKPCGRVRIARLADELGVSRESLRLLGTRWHREQGCPCWPMLGETGAPRGLMMRRSRRSGVRKFNASKSLAGSSLFFAPDLLFEDEPLVVVEGPTSTAAVMTAGFAAVGCPGNRHARETVCVFVEHQRPAKILVVGDADKAGLAMEKLTGAKHLGRYTGQVAFAQPPGDFTDVRDWLLAVGPESLGDELARLLP